MTERDNKSIHLTVGQARAKAENYCAYQERSQQEVRDKLYSWGLHKEDVESLVAELIENNFLNEERFAKSYALGKFRMKGWGKYKIKQGLKLKKVSEPLINIAIDSIKEDEYIIEIKKQALKKYKLLKDDHKILKKQKLYRFLLLKGYDNDIIFRIIDDIG